LHSRREPLDSSLVHLIRFIRTLKAEVTISKSVSIRDLPVHRVPKWVMPVARTAIFAVDGGLATLSFIAAFRIRGNAPVFAPNAWAWSREFVPYAGILFFIVAARLAMLLYQRNYNLYGAFSYTAESIRIFKAVAISSLLAVAWAFLFRGGFAFREFSYSRSVFLLDFGLALTSITLFHLVIRYLQTLFRRRHINLIPTVIVGTNSEAFQTRAELESRTDLGYRVIGLVSTGSTYSAAEHEIDLIGSIGDLPQLVRELGIQEVIITDNSLPSERLFETMMQVGRKQRVEFRFAPNLLNVLPQKTSVEQIGVLPMVRLFREPLSETERFVKRLSDMIISSIAILLLLPLWIAAAILIKLSSRGPVIFRQERVGMDGRIFLCLKFRTMTAGADESTHRDVYRKNIEGNRDANSGDEERPVFGKVKDDPRITPIGKWLRRSSIDELPQLFNVLKGDMSIVGPRPPIPYEVEDYDIWHRKRLDMKPGITGLWQVSGRNRLSFGEMVRIDLYYIENWSLWLDLKILLMTLPAIFRGDGAR
jgi:exopolysaccharide biosynthesis polyprenyl glycosylphosphotransferase